MKKFILTLLVGIGALCGIAFAQDFLIINNGNNKLGILLSEIESITHPDGDKLFITQKGQTIPYAVSSVDSITFINSEELDNECPSIYVLSPTSEPYFVTSEESITLSGIADDNIALSKVSFSTSSGNSGIALGTNEWVIPNLYLEFGDNVVDITAIDASNNETTVSITITRNQSLSFLGSPLINPDVLYVNTPQEVWITVNIAPNDKLISSSVRLIEIDENDNEIAEICNLYDNGDLNCGDEIKGDNIFSVLHTFNYSTQGTRRFRISAKTLENNSEVEGFSSVFSIRVMDYEQAENNALSVEEIHGLIEEKLEELSELSGEELINALIEWLPTLSGVESAVYDDGYIIITHTSGLTSYIFFPTEGYRGGVQVPLVEKRRTSKQIPLEKQTRGFFNRGLLNTWIGNTNQGALDNTVIQNRNVLIWAPYDNYGFLGIGNIPAMNPTPFENSPIELNVTQIFDENCTRATLKNLSNYGIVVFDTHGHGGDLLLTREEVNIKNNTDNYKKLEDVNDINWGYCVVMTMSNKKTYYAVTSKYFNRIIGKMPNSVVFNASCQSLKTDKIANALIARGAKTVVGFTTDVTNEVAAQKEQQFFSALVGDYLKTTGESFNNSDNSSYQMRGSRDMHFTLGLINGDFEYGNLNGWNTIGDGRVITQLASQMPTQGSFMGIISTGLGYTDNYGRISQTFQVTNETKLSVKWNFLSEEFLEYVGSIYQDYLRITIIDGDNSEVIFYKTVDDFAAEYSLVSVSPTIVFDRGGVYMTGWMTSTFNISKYQGKTVTLLIESGDVGDSIYDSATLLDEISIY